MTKAMNSKVNFIGNDLMKRFLLAAGVAVLLVGCGSAVKLDNVPVEDKTGMAVSPLGTGTVSGDTGTAGKSTVTGLDLSKTGQDAAALAGARIIYFDYDSFAIKPEFQTVIETHARYIKADKNRKAAIEGHTDERGGREYNLALGQKRSEAVRRALGLLGVSDAQVEAVSFGKEKPAAQGNDEAALAKNRRAEIAYR
jgi:peptidoglycan-associated lipoprotein